MMYGNYTGYGLGMYGGVLSFLFWIFIVVLIIKLVRHAFGGGSCRWERKMHMMGGMHRGMWGDKSMSTLRERYAKGEIDKTEFEQKKKDLEN